MRTAFATLLLSAAIAGAADVSELLEPIRERNGLAALAVASVVNGEIVDDGACGLRRADGKERVTIDDKWHLGSCTKSMTASVIAMLVDRGTLKWDTKVGDVFPESEMAPGWRDVTIDQLLSHRAGAPHDAPLALWAAAQARLGTPTEQRRNFVNGLLKTDPECAPGEKFVYSNQGYAIAGVMLEQVTGKPWETVMQEMLFGPLKLNTAGFGAPGSAALIDQPWGHLHAGKTLGPVTPGPFADNPPAIGPAGTVHMSIRDFARYAGWHAGEGKRDTPPGAAAFTKLHTAVGKDEYGLGWGVITRSWAGGRVLTHTGSNTMNFAVMWVAPERDFAVVAATNVAGEEAAKGCDEAVSLLIRRWKDGKK